MVDPVQDDQTIRVREIVQRIRHNHVPPAEALVQEVFREVGLVSGKVDTEEVLGAFNDHLEQVWEQTLRTLAEHEMKFYATMIPEAFMNEFPGAFQAAGLEAAEKGFRSGFARLFADLYPSFRESFLSISQSRMTRGGKEFPMQVEELLRVADVGFRRLDAYDTGGDGRRTRNLPILELTRRSQDLGMLLFLKRSLRERWAVVAEKLLSEQSGRHDVFLLTADREVQQSQVDSICRRYGMHLVVWDDVKLKLDRFTRNPLVLGYTEWANGYRDRLRGR